MQKKLLYIAKSVAYHLIFFGQIIAHARNTLYIFFDLPQTLVHTSKFNFFKDIIGITDSFTYSVCGGNLWKLEEATFRALDLLGKQEYATPSAAVRSDKGRVLPQILCDFLLSNISSQEAITRMQGVLHSHYSKGKERDLIARITQAIFSPTMVAKHTSAIAQAVPFLEQCAARFGANNLYIVANWHGPSMRELHRAGHMQEIMSYFSPNHIFVSGTTKVLLPNTVCFEKPIHQHNLDKKYCVFISGMTHHVHAAQKCGIKTIEICDGDYQQAFTELIDLQN